jgi:hypothetical protein
MVTKGTGEIATLTIYGHHRRIGYGYMKGEKKRLWADKLIRNSG